MDAYAFAEVEGTPLAPLWIGDVLHKAFIGVDEHGTEAAATVVLMPGAAVPERSRQKSALIGRSSSPSGIRDTQIGTVLFLGRVMNPLRVPALVNRLADAGRVVEA